MTTNGLMPGQGPSDQAAPPSGQAMPPGPSGPPGAPAPIDPSALHDQMLAQFNKFTQSRDMLDKVRVELTTLAKLGDTITPEDVIKGAGALVGHGMSPMELAGMLADMPEGGQALAGWVASKAQAATQTEAKLSGMIQQARGHLGAAALALIAQHAKSPGMSGPPGTAPAPINAMTPGAGNA